MGLSAISILQPLILVLTGIYIGISFVQYNTSELQNQSDITAATTVLSLLTDNYSNTRGDALDNARYQSEMYETYEQLKNSKDEITRLESMTYSLSDKYKSSLQKIQELENSCHIKDENKSDVKSAKANIHPVCQIIMRNPVPTAMDLWNQHMPKIFSASRIPRDTKFMYHDFTAQILQIISPRLPRSVKTTPFDWRPVENALTVAWERYQYLQLRKSEREAIAISDKPRPLKILVMGGSLLVGTNCPKMNKELNFQFGMPKRECNWSFRIQHFLNNFFLGDKPTKEIRTEELFDVEKVAMGGTNTATGSVIWQYDLIPEEARNPDIVINAYSTNDMHILTVLEAESSNITLRDRTFEMIQGFVRQILGSLHCSSSSDELIPPLLLHMDDYLGNEQRKIWETTELAQGAQVLGNYYGFVSISYADVIRELVYGDTYEKWFSSEWWVSGKPNKGKKTVAFERQIHPGMGMHIASIWVTAYNLLHLASTYCSMPTDAIAHLSKNTISEYQAGLWGLPDLDMRFKQPMGKPQPRPDGLPPELTKDLLLEDITTLWREQSSATNDEEQHLMVSATSSCKIDQNYKNGVSATARVKCPFSWVSGLSLQQNNVTWIKEYFEDQSSTWEGWTISEDGDKIGFIPSTGTKNGASARMILDFSYSQKIQSITFFFMKSYGTKWQNSELEAKVWSVQTTQTLLEERNMFGTHNKNTSEMYTEEMILSKPVDAGEKIRVEINLVGGEMFKIMGLAVCS